MRTSCRTPALAPLMACAARVWISSTKRRTVASSIARGLKSITSPAQSVENAAQPFRLFFGRLAPDRPRRHFVDECALVLPQPVAVPLGEQRHRAPARRGLRTL